MVTLPALVLAAGRSTRIEPLARGRPKPLLDVAGRSLLEWNLRWLAGHGVDRIWVNLHHGADAVRSAAERVAPAGVTVRFSHEPELLGTAGAWRVLSPEWDGTSLVVYGDNLMRFDLGQFLEAHGAAQAAGGLATVALFDPVRHGNTGIGGSRVVVGEAGRVVGFEETRGREVDRAGGALVSAGAYLLEPELAADVPPGYSDFGRDVLPALASRGALSGHVIEEGGFCLGLDTPEHFLAGVALVETGAVSLQ